MNMEINRYHFTQTKGHRKTDVMLDLTAYTDAIWTADILPYFEIDVLRGSRQVVNGRVIYHFKLRNKMAHVLKTAIVRAIHQVQGQHN